MLTVGVDLAAEPAGTAVATIEWSSGAAAVREVVVGAADEVLLDRIGRADKAGIDCPLGWPAAFVEFVRAHHEGHVTVPAGVAGLVWRRRLADPVECGARPALWAVPQGGVSGPRGPRDRPGVRSRRW